MPRICAVIPAAGKGSRLGLDCPKILVPITEKTTVWDVLRDSLSEAAEHIHVVLAPNAIAQFSTALEKNSSTKESVQKNVSLSAQEIPRGMGDAIFGAEKHWSAFDAIIVIWGDQVNLSEETVRAVAKHCTDDNTFVLPLVECQTPYVQYDVVDDKLTHVRQSREGDMMDAVGFSDVGIFGLSTKGLLHAWQKFLEQTAVGAQTNEINFLPFLPFLSQNCNWKLKVVKVADPIEALGINTKEDLQRTKERFEKLGR